MKELSNAVRSIAPSATLAGAELAKELKAQGLDVLSFGIGEPDFNTPEHIRQAAIDSINANESHYSTGTGILALRQAICRNLEETSHVSWRPENIAVSSGAKHIIFVLFQVLLNPGDEVIVPAPCWVTYVEAIRMAQGVPVIVETTEENGFLLTPEQLRSAVTEKTKCVLINNPCNPTGAMYPEPLLRELAEVIRKNDLYVLSDEIYSALVYEGRFVSMASLDEDMKNRTLLVSGVSKTYAMTGWRIGYVAACREVIALIETYISHSTGNPSNPAQYAALAAYNGDQSCVEDMRREFAERRKYFLSRLESMPYISCSVPSGAFYIFMNVKGVIGKEYHGELVSSAAHFSRMLLQYALLSVTTGEAFGMEGYVRWSYATSMDVIREGLDRLEKFLAELK